MIKEFLLGDYFYIGEVEYQIKDRDDFRVYYHKDNTTGERSFFDVEYLKELIKKGVVRYTGKRDPYYERMEKIWRMEEE